MTCDEVVDRINEIVIDLIGEDPHTVLGPSDSLAHDLGMRYADVNKLVKAVEDDFHFLLNPLDQPPRDALLALSDIYDLACNKLRVTV